jgi:hypothetical protein
MTWICSFGVVNCPICQRSREDIKEMKPNIPDKTMDKIIKQNKIDLHRKIETVSIEITTDGQPKIEVKGRPLDKDGKPKIPANYPGIPSITGNNPEPWDSKLGLDDLTISPWTMSVKEGDIPPLISRWFTSATPSINWSTSFGADEPAYPSDYQFIGSRTKKKPEVQRVDKLVPTSKPYKDMKDNDEPEFYKRQGIKCYTARDGKNTIIVDRKSEIQY